MQSSEPDGPTTPISPLETSGRLPSHVFRTTTANRVEWSATSNDSLFSINAGNMSFNKEQMELMSKSGEFGYNYDPFISSPLMELPTTRLFTETDTNGGNCNESAAELAPHSRNLSQLSDASVKSFAFPILTGDEDKTQQSEPSTNPKESPDTPTENPKAEAPEENPEPEAPEETPKQESLKSQSQKNAGSKKWFTCFSCCASCS
ncbi:hypothetical protein like AT1G74220 [Hibiscus trionum]|uniref:Uncharacterized protein n=1 Tax=Hibiscus trionum TaxID=183268 RepID=A0A9W7J0B7_HIBTR|nr:hypothetical protein like AT1G74220 [Hibiscus trionum]